MNSIEFIAVDAMIQDYIIKHVHDSQPDGASEAEHYVLFAEKMKAYLSIKDCIEKALEQVSFNKSNKILDKILNNSKVSNERIRRIVDTAIRNTIDDIKREAKQMLNNNKKEININLKKQLVKVDEKEVYEDETDIDEFLNDDDYDEEE